MKIQKKATIISTTTAFLLAVIKLITGIVSGSIAVISSAIDSLLDMLVSMFNTFALHNAEKEPDATYHYGRGKTEALAAFLEGLIIGLSGVYIAYESIQKILHPETSINIEIGVGVMIFSLLVTSGLVFFLSSVAKKTGNLVMSADALHYKSDVLSNGIILLGLVIISFTGWYMIDGILGLAISVYIVISAASIVKKWYGLLLDISLSEEENEKIRQAIQAHKGINTFHAFRTRQSGETKFVEAHLVFDSHISLLEAHTISHEIEDSIRAGDTNASWSILFHLDPYNDEPEDVNGKREEVISHSK